MTVIPEALPRVLVVDDSRFVRAKISRDLQGVCEVREEADGEAAWQALTSDPSIRLLITDLGMPRLDGVGLLERLRNSGLTRLHELPALVLTGDDAEGALGRARLAGASGFLLKGDSPEALVRRVRQQFGDQGLEGARPRLAADGSRPAPAPLQGLLDLGQRALSLSQRQGSPLLVMVVGVRGIEGWSERFGDHTVARLSSRLALALAQSARLHDCIAEMKPGRFVFLCPGAGATEACGLESRVRNLVRGAKVSVQGERLELDLRVGMSEAGIDHPVGFVALLDRALDRLRDGEALPTPLMEERAVRPEIRTAAQPAAIHSSKMPALRGLQESVNALVASPSGELEDCLGDWLAILQPLLVVAARELGPDTPLSRLAGEVSAYNPANPLQNT